VRYWHKADFSTASIVSALSGKAEIGTWPYMSVPDPSRTLAVAGLGRQLAVHVTSSSSSSSGTKPLPPHLGHCCSSSVPFSMTPSPLQSGQVFTCASL